MPRDQLPAISVFDRAATAVTGRERLEILVEVLDLFNGGEVILRKTTFKSYFIQKWRWDFAAVQRQTVECGSSGCAIGIAQWLWPDIDRNRAGFDYFGMPVLTYEEIFFSGHRCRFADVTPKMVADAIRRYLYGERRK